MTTNSHRNTTSLVKSPPRRVEAVIATKEGFKYVLLRAPSLPSLFIYWSAIRALLYFMFPFSWKTIIFPVISISLSQNTYSCVLFVFFSSMLVVSHVFTLVRKYLYAQQHCSEAALKFCKHHYAHVHTLKKKNAWPFSSTDQRWALWHSVVKLTLNRCELEEHNDHSTHRKDLCPASVTTASFSPVMVSSWSHPCLGGTICCGRWHRKKFKVK